MAVKKLGSGLTDKEYAAAIHQRDVFREWMLTNVLPQPSTGQDFDKILMMPNGYMDPFYRHEYDGWGKPLSHRSNGCSSELICVCSL